jgi:glycosyltransferase involved in cell wall biosynthesis
MTTKKRLLLVAFHTPPFQGSTGVTRTLAFAKYLREHDWQVTILTATAGAYPDVRSENLVDIPADVRVTRAWALDTQRHLSLFGRYPWWLASPDRWRSWFWPAVLRGCWLARTWNPHVIMSTYPIATAHRIGAALARLTRVPWVADMRDPMVEDEYPTHPGIREAFKRIEQRLFERAARVLVTTQTVGDMYADRFPAYQREKIVLISNGFDEERFPGIMPPAAAGHNHNRRPLLLLHSGVLYPVERDPAQFFSALSELQTAGRLSPADAQFVFRGAGNEERFANQVRAHGIDSLVQFRPMLPYREALAEMVAADAFLVFQGSICNAQIPAKVYEYLYMQKPILGITDPSGETARLMLTLGSDRIVNDRDKTEIGRAIPAFLEGVRSGTAPVPRPEQVARFSRRNVAGALANVLNALVSERKV